MYICNTIYPIAQPPMQMCHSYDWKQHLVEVFLVSNKPWLALNLFVYHMIHGMHLPAHVTLINARRRRDQREERYDTIFRVYQARILLFPPQQRASFTTDSEHDRVI